MTSNFNECFSFFRIKFKIRLVAIRIYELCVVSRFIMTGYIYSCKSRYNTNIWCGGIQKW